MERGWVKYWRPIIAPRISAGLEIIGISRTIGDTELRTGAVNFWTEKINATIIIGVLIDI